MPPNKKNLLELRKRMKTKRPSFRRVESWRNVRVKDSWRKARGIDSQTRMKEKSGVKSPSVGYRVPKRVRGLHPSGYEEVRVFTIKDLEELNNKKHAIKISGRLGARKRQALVEYAQRKNFKILNLGTAQREIARLEEMLDASIPGIDDEDYVDVDDLEDKLDLDE